MATSGLIILGLATLLASINLAAACDINSLNITESLYYVSKPGTTIFQIAKETNRGICDIGRHNIMADVCNPDNETCLLPKQNATRNCIYGGPRLYYTVNGDTYDIIARRLNITTESVMSNMKSNETATTPLAPGQFVKISICYLSKCVVQPYSFKYGVYKDLAEKFGTTVGQIMMLSPTYNYSSSALRGETPPSINVAINCTLLSSNYTVLD
ncbi:hypothetical protein DTO271D3_2396 [Paecilomyces variotii]|nr:hypothetical protein DTO271D3_2396 [Paecilomyces variotii]